MGWFKRLLKLEDSEDVLDEITEETVPLDMLPDWVDQKSSAGFEAVKPDIEVLFEKVLAEKRRLSHQLKELQDAELHNPNISEREKQIMEGNREAYISQHKQFINFLTISDDLSCKETLSFCKNFEELLVRLAKSTAKGHAVTSQFFGNQASSINKTIKTMSDSVSKIKEILEDSNVGVESFDDVQKAVAELKAKKKLLGEIDEELCTLKKKLENSEFMKGKLNKKIDEIKQTDDYSDFDKSNSEREQLWKTVKQCEDDANALFSPINKAMRKFERILAENTELFQQYIDDPISALKEDDGLKIMAMIEKMKFKLMDSTLEVKDSDKAVQRIGEITRSRLEQLRNDYMDSKTKIKVIDDRMRSSKVLGDIDDLQYKIEHVDNQIKILQDKIDFAEKTRSKIDLDALKGGVQKRILDAFNVEAKITWQGQIENTLPKTIPVEEDD